MKSVRFILIPAVLFLLGGSALPAFAQQKWQRTYGGTGDDYGYSVQQTSDGGYIVAGQTNSFGNWGQVYLIKTNASGDTLWTRTYGGTTKDLGYSVQQTSDGGYIIAGWTIFLLDSAKVYLLKTNSSGDTLWTKTYGVTYCYFGYSVQQTTDGGYIIAGYAFPFDGGYDNVYLIKTNASGDSLWTKTYGGTNTDWCESVQQTMDGGYIMAGGTASFGAGNYDVYLIKTNVSGDTLWTKTYGGTNGEYGHTVQQTMDGGYIIAGQTQSFGAGGEDVYLIKTNASGDTLWTRTYGGTDNDEGWSVQQTTDGGYLVAGGTVSFGNNEQVFLIKTNASGDTLWTTTFGGPFPSSDMGYSVQQTTDGGYIVAGATNSFGAGGYDVYLIKTDANGNVGVEDKAASSTVSRFPFSVRPNPFLTSATVPGHSTERFALYDISGRRVGTYRGDRIGEGLAAGVYFLKAKGVSSPPIRVVKVR